MEPIAGPPSMVFQLVITLVGLVVIYGVMTLVDKSMNAYNSASQANAVLIQDTTQDTSIIPQSLQSGAPLIYPSSNQPGGRVFSYSCFLNIAADTFTNSSAASSCSAGASSNGVSSTVLKHIFSKGTAKSFPLMAPGVFCRGDKNTLRIYMNTTNSWDNHVEVDNIPIAKWFHMVITLDGKYMKVYINGNVASAIQFHTVPQLNIGPVFIFNNRQFPDGTSLVQKDFVVNGAAKGMISRLQYFAYTLNASQIDNLYRQGPSSKIMGSTVTQLVPYTAETWWTNQLTGSAAPPSASS
jgi:Concanavalin A-like lectin/glucanases superfamily